MKIFPLLAFLVIACSSNEIKSEKDPVTPKKKIFSPLTDREKAYYQHAIEHQYNLQLVKTGFNGGILFAKNGEIVFEDYRGLANFKTKEPITANSTFHIASISKTFTSAAVLQLVKQGKLSLEDPINRFFPNFPYAGINIKLLLNHRSGLPKYEYFMDKTSTQVYYTRNKRGKRITHYRVIKNADAIKGLVNNEDMLQFLITKHPPIDALPNRRYQYCNTNFALLALIVERVTGKSFPAYMDSAIFKPLGMTHTRIFSMKDTASYQPSYNYNKAPFPLEKFDCIYGDKNVYSNVRDLLIWDRALYEEAFIDNSLQNLAYEPYSFEQRGEKNYGLGWHLLIKKDEPKIVYHNGWWHGNNAVFKRLIADTATVIILGNKFNKSIWTASKMSSIFTGHADTSNIEE